MKISKKNHRKPTFVKKNGKAKFSRKITSKSDSRVSVLTKQLRDFGKVGGLVDKRIGVKGEFSTSADAALRRHIIEKLRKMESLGTTLPGDDDPMIKIASSGKFSKKASFDDDLGGLSADIVDTELFAGGLFSERQSTADDSRRAGQDALLDKIAATKEERLKRVEENEEQRNKLKHADIEWADKVRFMLEKLSGLKPRNKNAAIKLEKSRNYVFNLLNKLSTLKTVAPIGARFETESVKFDKIFGNLEAIISRKIELSDETTFPVDESRSEDILLRLLCKIPSCKCDTIGFIAAKLQSLSLQTISDAVLGLLLANILIEFIQSKLMPSTERPVDKFNQSERLVGIFIPEIVQFLTKLFLTVRKSEDLTLCCVSFNPHLLKSNAPCISEKNDSLLNIQIGTGVIELAEDEESLYRILCLRRLAHLSLTILKIYSSNFPLPAVLQLFSPMVSILGPGASNLQLSNYPDDVKAILVELADCLQKMKTGPTPPRIITANKISLLLANKTASPQTLQKAGLVPQLEPRFDEKLDARRPKKRAGNVELRQQLAKEKRGAMKELRKDAQCLANFDLQKIKTSDEIRKKKTQAIIGSLRSIE